MLQQLHCVVNNDYTLSPVPSPVSNSVIVSLAVSSDPVGGTTGVLSWNNQPQAFIVYDLTGTRINGYTPVSTDPVTIRSIDNIIQSL